MPWRKITADQYRTGDGLDEGFDEARIADPETGWKSEVWDCGEHLVKGKVVIHTASPEELHVPTDYPIEIR